MRVAKLYQGDTWRRSWILKSQRTGAVIDLSGASATVLLRNHYGVPVFTASTEAGGGLSIDGPAGRVNLEINNEITGMWPAGSYTFKFRLVNDYLTVFEDTTLIIKEY